MAFSAARLSLPASGAIETFYHPYSMAFNPTLPLDGSLMVAAEMRDQFNGLKGLIDAQPVTAYGRVASDWTNSSATFTDISGLSFAVGAGYVVYIAALCL